MSSPAQWFVGFCALVVVLLGLLIWQIGPNLVGLALDGDRRGNPYRVFYLLSSSQQAVELLDSHATVSPPLPGTPVDLDSAAAQNAPVPAHQLGAWAVSGLLDGAAWQQRHALVLLEYATAGQFIRSRTGDDLPAGSSRRNKPIVLGTSATVSLSAAKPMILWVLTLTDFDLARNELDIAQLPYQDLVKAAVVADGRLAWQAPIDMLSQPAQSWNWGLALEFASEQALLDWVQSPSMVTERALMNSRVDAQSGWIVVPAN